MRELNDSQELTLSNLNMIDIEGARFECGMIGAIGNKFNNTQDLNVMN